MAKSKAAHSKVAHSKPSQPVYKLPNLEQLRSACRFWQSILRLQDWHVEVFITRARDMKSEAADAENWYNPTLKKSRIRIIDPLDYEGFNPQDMEESLVHELIHLHLALFTGHLKSDDDDRHGNGHYVAFEQATDIMAEAYVSLYRFLPEPPKEFPDSNH